MKNTLIVTLLLLTTITSYAQERKGYIGLALGPSVPTGNYAKTSINNDESGYAMTGFHFNVNFGYKFTDNIGIAGLWMGSGNPIDVNELVNVYYSIEPSYDWELEAESAWAVGGLMGGLLITLPMDQIDIEFRGLVGYSSCIIPKITITAYDGIDSAEIIQHEDTAIGFAYNLGAGFRYHLGEKFDISANVDYFSTKPEFEVAVTSDFGASDSVTAEQPIDMINLSFGVAYRLK